MEFKIIAYFVGVGLSAGFNAKYLGVCIVFSIGLLYAPDANSADFLMMFFVPALLLAGFRG